ncbi:hypothetical protein ACIGO9_11580 [Nocardia asteroides]|uniref:hypothetical protein n=1 Tax=Nocardia asteroides TaxID=1824 RepID=UPI0034394034
MNASWIRRAHRWCAIAFTVILLVTVLTLAVGGPAWVSYLPLLPLAGLFLTGLAVYVQVYRRQRARGGAPAGGVRPIHRWSAVVFVVTVLATVIALSLPDPIVWVSYLPLLPLAALFFTGLYMLTAPRLRARRARVRA